MKFCILTPFIDLNSEVSRPNFIRSVLISNGYSVETDISDFSHTTKEKIIKSFDLVGVLFIKKIPYKSNTSIVRFFSHLKLALDLFLFAFRKDRASYDVFLYCEV